MLYSIAIILVLLWVIGMMSSAHPVQGDWRTGALK
ncbi:MAG TPA: DUF5670 family protein [Burkholderiales bacterium]|nr:DUF5670 family protein [Burkholderiales bacterium]